MPPKKPVAAVTKKLPAPPLHKKRVVQQAGTTARARADQRRGK